jgi:hypothetical protein
MILTGHRARFLSPVEPAVCNQAIDCCAGSLCANPSIGKDSRRRRLTAGAKPRLRRLTAIAVMMLTIGPMVALGSTAWADPPGDAPSAHTERNRKVREQQFLREHSDASGKPRPDVWREGVEQQKNMTVAPYIGWHPSATQSKKSGSGDTSSTH